MPEENQQSPSFVPLLDEGQSTELSDALSSDANLVGRFKIFRSLGSGAQAVVYEAEELLLGRRVALKVLQSVLALADNQDRIKKEGQLLATLDHPHIVKTYASGLLTDGRTFLVMELVNGESLASMLERRTLSGVEFCTIFSQVLEALEYLHQHSILHRDLKPANILVEATEQKLNAKIVDFGIAKLVDVSTGSVSSTQTRSIGTAAYISPEQSQSGNLDARTDLYSLACVMYESLIGAPPFVGNSDYEVMYKHVSEKANLESLPKIAQAFFEKALAKNPEDRFRNAFEMRTSLPPSSELDSDQFSQNKRKLTLQKRGSHFSPWTILTACGVLIVVTLAVVVTQRESMRKQDQTATQRDTAKDQQYKDTQRRRMTVKARSVATSNTLEDDLDNVAPGDRVALSTAILEKYPSPKYFKARMKAYHMLSAALYSLGEYPKVLEINKQAIKEAQKYQNLKGAPIELAASYESYSRTLSSLGFVKEASDALLRVTEIYAKFPDEIHRDRRAGAKMQLANILMGQNDLKGAEKAMLDAKEILQDSEGGRFTNNYGDCIFQLSDLLFKQGRYKEGMTLMDEAIKLTSSQLPDYYLMGHLVERLNVAANYLRKSQYHSKAMEYLDRSEKLLKSDEYLPALKTQGWEPRFAKVNQQLELARNSNIRGKLLLQENDREKGIAYLRKAIEYADQESAMPIDSLVFFASDLLQAGCRDDAERAFLLARDKRLKYSDTKSGAKNCPSYHLGIFNWQYKKDLAQAEKYLLESQEYWKKNPDPLSTMGALAQRDLLRLRQLKRRS